LVSWIVEVDDVVWSRVDGAKTGPLMAGGRPGGSSHPLATSATAATTAPARYARASPPIGGGPSSGSAATLASAIAETNAE
jgi:hypothetical protein